MADTNTNGIDGEDIIKILIDNIRSDDDSERKTTISKIPSLILKSLKDKDRIIDQLLLIIYNLNTDRENYETLTAGNRAVIIRHLLRLYIDIIDEHEQKQIQSLISLVDYFNSSDLLVELANVLFRCTQSMDDAHQGSILEALDFIEDKATVSLYPEALLMIHSIKSLRYGTNCDTITTKA